MYENRELYRAIAEAAYAIARAGDGLQSEERESFYEILRKSLDFDSWSAQSRFELLEELHPDPVKAFDYAISEIKKYKGFLTIEIKQHALDVVEAVAMAYNGKNAHEADLINRFKKAMEWQ